MVLWNEARAMGLSANGAKEFLQGYLTCNTDNISEDSYLPFALCDIKGRVLANGWGYSKRRSGFSHRTQKHFIFGQKTSGSLSKFLPM